jgi:hypothetical protein
VHLADQSQAGAAVDFFALEGLSRLLQTIEKAEIAMSAQAKSSAEGFYARRV